MFSNATYNVDQYFNPDEGSDYIPVDEIAYCDKNSLYPYIMSSKPITGTLDPPSPHAKTYYRQSPLTINSHSLYGLKSFKLSQFFM